VSGPNSGLFSETFTFNPTGSETNLTDTHYLFFSANRIWFPNRGFEGFITLKFERCTCVSGPNSNLFSENC
jgi:hypothetical protein